MESIVTALPCIPIFIHHEPFFPCNPPYNLNHLPSKQVSFLVIGTPAYQLEWISFCVCRTIKQNIIREFHHHMQVAGRFDLFA